MHAYAVNKHTFDQAGTAIRTRLPSYVAAAILRVWTEDTPDPEDLRLTQRALQDLKARDQWLGCGCVDSPAMPLLAIVQSHADGVLFLRRMQEREPHAPTCPFAFEQASSHRGSTERHEDGSGQPDFVFREQAEPAGHRHRTAQAFGTFHEAQTDSVARRLFWLLRHAGLNRWPAPAETAHASAAARLLASSETVRINSAMTLRDVLFCSHRAWFEGWMDSAFRACRKAGLRQQAWWVVPVVDIDLDKQLLTVGAVRQPVPVAGRLTVFAGEGSAARMPMLALAAVTSDESTGNVTVARAYVHPVESERDWMLVDSENERRALACLKAAALAYRGTAIVKPMHHMRELDCRPDFILCAPHGGDQLLVETMGLTDPGYVSKKRDLVERLRNAGHMVFEDQRAFAEPGDADARLAKFSAGWLARRKAP
jgi:hypothetical protein